MLELFGKLLIAYLLGSVSGSLLLGRFRGVDIRTQGSGNAGGTNALRTQGWRFALGVIVIDVGKGVLAAALGYWNFSASAAPLGAYEQALACGFVATLGHIYPLFHGFRGGKGAGTLAGALCVVAAAQLPYLLLVFLLVLSLTGYVGLSTVAAGLTFALLALSGGPPPLAMFGALSGALLIFTHRANLDRVRRGTEYRFERARVLGRLWHP